MAPPRDPYKYFRVEARELMDGMKQGVLELGKNGPNSENVGRVLRHAHTLKGASRVVHLGQVSQLVHGIEEALSPWREGAGDLPAGLVDRLLAVLDSVDRHLAHLDAPGRDRGGPVPVPDKRLETVRVELAELDALLECLREASGRLAHLRGGTAALAGLSDRILGGLEQIEREIMQAQERAARMRLLPVSMLFDFLERICHDAASTLGKNVSFESSGGDQRLEAPVLLALQEALQHVVRNAVAHGIESPAGRAAAGKAVQGRVRIQAGRKGGKIHFLCGDDGAGIDLALVRRAAQAKGMLEMRDGQPLEMEDALKLLLKGGLSTSERVTELSGRGLGMDVLRETVIRLKGELKIRSEPGNGLEYELQLPYSLSSFSVLEVESGGVVSLVPFEAVHSALRVQADLISHSIEGDSLFLNAQSLAFAPLAECLGGPGQKSGHLGAGLVLKSSRGMAAVGVDKILRLRQAVMLPIPQRAPAGELWAGSCLDASGNPCLVLDPDALVLAARARRGAPAGTPTADSPALLVIDDSLTTRMLEQSILETAGYEVDLAASAEEGLAMALRKRYGLILVDVEMPGMNGFEFLERMKTDAVLRDIPAILVSSRCSSEDLQRGREAGARDYIVKGEFDQARLLRRIREIL